MKLSSSARILAAALVVYIIFDVFLTPLGGLETRPAADVTALGYSTVLVLFLGLALSVVSLAFLASKPRRSSAFALIGLGSYFPAFLADQLGIFSSQTQPVGIFWLEEIQAVVAIVGLFFTWRVRKEKAATSSSAEIPK